MLNSRDPMYKLVSADLLRSLMQRTGSGQSLSVRDLATAVGVPRGTIGNLLTGETKSQPERVAHAIARVIGVDLLVLWVPIGRAVPAPAGENQPQAVPA